MPFPESRIVLVAEDNAISSHLLVHQLGLLDCEAVACDNGALALEAWRSGRFGLLLTDLHMPVLDGFALAAAIRAEERADRMPIIAMTAGFAEEAERCPGAGIDDCLIKPASLVLLRAALDRWLPERRETAASGGAGP